MYYKLIAMTELGDKLNNEYDHVVHELQEAETEAEKLRLSLKNEYPNCIIECHPYHDNLKYPLTDFRIWKYDHTIKKAYWHWMKVTEFGTRLYIYIK